MERVGIMHSILHRENDRRVITADVYLLDEKRLLVRNFNNELNGTELEAGLNNGYFIVGFKSFSQPLGFKSRYDFRTAKNKTLLSDGATRQKLFKEASANGSYIKYPKNVKEVVPMPVFGGKMNLNGTTKNDIILE